MTLAMRQSNAVFGALARGPLNIKQLTALLGPGPWAIVCQSLVAQGAATSTGRGRNVKYSLVRSEEQSMWKCQECGKKFRTVKAAERAANDGCPGCGGVDVDTDVDPTPRARTKARKVPAPQPRDGYHGEEPDPLRPPVGRCPHGVLDNTVCLNCVVASRPF